MGDIFAFPIISRNDGEDFVEGEFPDTHAAKERGFAPPPGMAIAELRDVSLIIIYCIQ
jgi:hypothetical protein